MTLNKRRVNENIIKWSYIQLKSYYHIRDFRPRPPNKVHVRTYFQSCYTLLLKYCKNINNVLFWQLWTYLVAFIKNNNANFDVYLDAKNELHSCLLFWDIVKILQACCFENFENAWSCLSIMIISPCRKLCRPKYWNQLVENL